MTTDLAKIVASHPLTVALQRDLDRIFPATRRGLLVAASGGPDSMALLAALASLGVRPLVAGHVNHCLRGAESDGDAAFVQQISARLGIEFCGLDGAVPAGAGVEASARRIRYEKLLEMSQSYGLTALATAHTLDDQAETVIMRLLRGTGVAGLGGIPAVRQWRGLRIIRPLLRIRRKSVLDFLDVAGLPWRHDSSNDNLCFTRNQIRHQLLPLLVRSGHRRLIERLGILSRDARRLYRQTMAQARLDLQLCELDRAGPWVVFDLARLGGLATIRQIEMWRAVWKRESWPCGAMSRKHWRRLVDALGSDGAALDCPGGIRVRRLARIVRAGPDA